MGATSNNTYRVVLAIISLLLCQLSLIPAAHAERSYQRVQVVDPYIELRTGPGRGFPIFYVGERGEWIAILLRKTDWFKVRLEQGKEGWVNRTQLENTLTEAGVKKSFRDVLMDDYLQRRLEFGLATGSFEGDTVLSFRLGYMLTSTLSSEVTYGQVQGVFAGSTLYHVDLQSQPYPEWRLAPFFTIGVGKFNNIPKTTLVSAITTDSIAANAGFGVRYYITRRFMARADLMDYVVFIDDNRTDSYKSATAGFSFFF
jgi:hypothetical protein